MNPEFLEVDDLLELRAGQIAEHGGSEGRPEPRPPGIHDRATHG